MMVSPLFLQVGTAVVTRDCDGRLAIGRLGALCEQVNPSLNPQPRILNPKPETLNPKPELLSTSVAPAYLWTEIRSFRSRPLPPLSPNLPPILPHPSPSHPPSIAPLPTLSLPHLL